MASRRYSKMSDRSRSPRTGLHCRPGPAARYSRPLLADGMGAGLRRHRHAVPTSGAERNCVRPILAGRRV